MTRAAVLGTEVLSLVVKKTSGHQSHQQYKQFKQDGPQLPLFEGATQDLVLQMLGRDFRLNDLFSTIHRLFGTKIRRIHLTDDLKGVEWIPSAQTQGAYLGGQEGKDLGAVDWILAGGPFINLTIMVPNDAPRGGSPIESMFEHEDALMFGVSGLVAIPSPREGIPDSQQHPYKVVQICEILRYYKDGRMTMNKGLSNVGVEGRDYRLCSITREVFGYFVEYTSNNLPDLEYISICVPFSAIDPTRHNLP